MHIHYLEIVTPDIDATCQALGRAHQVSFSDPVAELGNARIAALNDGGKIGVRAPMSADESPIVRPYTLVTDIDAAVETVVAAGAELAHPPLELPGHGTFAIYIQGGIQYGFWEL